MAHEATLHLPKFHRLKPPLGYINLHEALNRLGRARHPAWGIGKIWISHPFFMHNGKFERWKLENKLLKNVQIKFKAESIDTAKAAARMYATVVNELSLAFQSHAVTGYLLGNSHDPIEIPMQSIQWVRQERSIFSTGFMRHAHQRLRIVVWEDDFQKWLEPERKSSKNFRVADAEFIAATIKLLDGLSDRNEHFRYTCDALWKLLSGDLSHHLKRGAFRSELFSQINERSRKVGRGPPQGWEIQKFEELKGEILEGLRQEVRLLQSRRARP